MPHPTLGSCRDAGARGGSAERRHMSPATAWAVRDSEQSAKHRPPLAWQTNRGAIHRYRETSKPRPTEPRYHDLQRPPRTDCLSPTSARNHAKRLDSSLSRFGGKTTRSFMRQTFARSQVHSGGGIWSHFPDRSRTASSRSDNSNRYARAVVRGVKRQPRTDASRREDPSVHACRGPRTRDRSLRRGL